MNINLAENMPLCHVLAAAADYSCKLNTAKLLTLTSNASDLYQSRVTTNHIQGGQNSNTLLVLFFRASFNLIVLIFSSK